MSVLNPSWGLLQLDRLNKVHRPARVELPKSVTSFTPSGRTPKARRRLKPGAAQALAIAGFMTCGGVIIATCGLLAAYIQ